MKILNAVHPDDFKNYSTEKIRERFLVDQLCEPGKINFVYSHYDRMIIGAAIPLSSKIDLPNFHNLRAEYFLQRREMGIINIGGKGIICVDDKEYSLSKLDCIYIGKETLHVNFASDNRNDPAVFYILSALAHTKFPTRVLKKNEVTGGRMGSAETANRRSIYRYIHKEGLQSCQLVMGLTILEAGSVWNTIPPHTHDRRMEVYFYFDLPDDQLIFHYMGQQNETRHIIIKNNEAIVSPPWSVHAGSGTSSYGFIWGMAGENQEYTDMDIINLKDLK